MGQMDIVELFHHFLKTSFPKNIPISAAAAAEVWIALQGTFFLFSSQEIHLQH